MNPVFQRARFLSAASGLDHAPPDQGAEVAFAGRSNAGKSSALNALCHQKRLARTSKTPGRTQQLVFFRLEDDDHRLVDLPGYGFAKVPQAVKAKWMRELERYLQERQSLRGLVLLMDIRHPFQDFDRQMLEWGAAAGMPVRVLLTKADKLKRGPAKNALLAARKTAAAWPDDLVSVQLFSALRHEGHRELTAVLDRWLTDASVLDEAGSEPP